jgi:hypothetical protein
MPDYKEMPGDAYDRQLLRGSPFNPGDRLGIEQVVDAGA